MALTDKLTAIADGFRLSRGTSKKYTLDDMAILAAENIVASSDGSPIEVEKNINVCGTALNGGKSPSAIYDLIKGRTKCSKVSTIKAFCQGAGITLSEFFDKEYFNDFEE